MKMIYGVHDRPSFGKTLLFALQQLLAIVSATIAVPMIVGNGLQPSAALFGAGVATIVYLLITKFKSPVFFGSSFAFIGSMCAAFAGGVSMSLGYLGIIIGSAMAGSMSIIFGLLVKKFGVNWIYRLLPYCVIGPVVAIIGLSLAETAVSGIWAGSATTSPWVAFAIAMITLFTTIAVATYGKKMAKLVPFAIGIGVGYVVSLAFTGVGYAAGIDALKVIDFAAFKNMQWYPSFTFLTALKGVEELNWAYVGTIALAFIPVSIVTMTEHIADHQNISTIIESNLLEDPGLHRTLIGDGLADAIGAALGGCSTTSYGESIGCVALTKNASTISILTAALMAIVVSFIGPVSALLSTIPSCVLNAVCFLLYGFIAVSGLKMLTKVDLEDNRNVFVISVILVSGVGGLLLSFGQVTITTVACSLILGVLANILVNLKKQPEECHCECDGNCCNGEPCENCTCNHKEELTLVKEPIVDEVVQFSFKYEGDIMSDELVEVPFSEVDNYSSEECSYVTEPVADETVEETADPLDDVTIENESTDNITEEVTEEVSENVDAVVDVVEVTEPSKFEKFLMNSYTSSDLAVIAKELGATVKFNKADAAAFISTEVSNLSVDDYTKEQLFTLIGLFNSNKKKVAFIPLNKNLSKERLIARINGFVCNHSE